MPAMSFRCQLVRARPLSPSVRSLVFRAEGLRWEAGQYVELEVAPGVRKPYSIASAMGAHGPGELEIAVVTGSGSQLENLTPGSVIIGHGPAGVLERSSGLPHAFVAAGTGVSPFRAMLQHELSEPGHSVSLLLLCGYRAEPDILWRAELEELAARHPRFHFVPTLSRPTDSWTGRRGYVQEHLEELVLPLAELGAAVYVCGSSEMVGGCVGRLEELGVARSSIFTERA